MKLLAQWSQIIPRIAPFGVARLAGGASLCFIVGGCGADGRPPPPGTLSSKGGSGGGSESVAGGGSRLTSSSSLGGSALNGSGGGAMASGTGATGGGTGGAGGSGNMPSNSQATSCQASAECLQLCVAVGGDTSCGLGNAQQCACVCEDRLSGPCPGQLATLAQCVAVDPQPNCGTGSLIFNGCEAASLALESCEVRVLEQSCATNFPSCTSLCEPLTLAFCSQSPETVASCLCGCESTFEVACRTQFDAFMTCSDEQPSFQCDSTGLPVPGSCTTQWSALMDCQAALVVAN